MKRLLVIIPIVVLVIFAFPVVNLFVGSPETALATLDIEDPVLSQVTHILANKCVNCHTTEYQLPWYGNFPIARGIIEQDIEAGLRTVDIVSFLPPPDGEAADEVFLAKVEWTTQQNTMPPMHYLALHWNHRLSGSEKQTILDWVSSVRAAHYRVDGVSEAFANEPVQPLPAVETLGLDDDKVALGNKLFHDVRLSADDTISCASCHDLAMGGTDQAPVSTGIRGQFGPINSPTVFNTAFQFAQFWDGRAADLEEQAGGPVTDPLEMDAEWPDVLAKLAADEAFMEEFRAVYDELNDANVRNAIAEFQRSLLTPDSDFDRYLKGEEDAMSPEALRGYARFKELGCATCHVGRIFGGRSFEYMGYRKDYFAGVDRELIPQDDGRYNVTGDERDRHKFKVPTLLNIEVTFPYFHDASAETLEEAIQTMAEYQSGVRLRARDVEHLVAFLKSLTGTYQGEKLE